MAPRWSKRSGTDRSRGREAIAGGATSTVGDSRAVASRDRSRRCACVAHGTADAGRVHERSCMSTELTILSNETLIQVTAGDGSTFWRKAGEYVAPALMLNPATSGLGVQLANKPALAQGGIWAAGGAIAGARGGPWGLGLGALGGGLAGYYSTLVGRDFPAQ